METNNQPTRLPEAYDAPRKPRPAYDHGALVHNPPNPECVVVPPRTHEDARENPQAGDRYNYLHNPGAYDEVLEVLADGTLYVRKYRGGDADSARCEDMYMGDWTCGATLTCWVPCAE